LGTLQREHEKQTGELDKSNRWAEQLNTELSARRARVEELQMELAAEQEKARAMSEGYAAKVAALEGDIREKTQWAFDVETALKADVARQTAELVRAVDALHHTEQELESRTAWARSLEAELNTVRSHVALYRESRWVKLGRKVGLGPAFPAN
jgi:predicted  nucleic acid-binding Zn-ribbon protein